MDHLPLLLWKINNNHEEYVNVIMPYIKRNLMEPTSCHNSVLTGVIHINEIVDGHECHCRREFRMEIYMFHTFVRMLKEKRVVRRWLGDNGRTSSNVFIYSCQKYKQPCCARTIQRSSDTVSRHFYGVLEAISQLSSKIIMPPPLHTLQYIRSRLKFYPFFKVIMNAFQITNFFNNY